jgi:hypothetical protein
LSTKRKNSLATDKNNLATGRVIEESFIDGIDKRCSLEGEAEDPLRGLFSLRIVKILKTTARRLGQGLKPVVFFFGCGLLAQVARAHP